VNVAKSVAFLGELKKKDQEIEKHYIHDMYFKCNKLFSKYGHVATFSSTKVSSVNN